MEDDSAPTFTCTTRDQGSPGMHMHVRISSHVHGCCLPILARGEGRRNGTTRHEV